VVFALGDPAEVRIVQKIYQLRLQGLGYRAIALSSTLRAFLCQTGRWRNTDRKWSTGTIAAIVENPTYMGAKVFNRHPQSHLKGPSKPAWKNNPENWVLVEDAHPVIVSKETWHLANDARKPYSRKNRFYLDSPVLAVWNTQMCPVRIQLSGYYQTSQKEKWSPVCLGVLC